MWIICRNKYTSRILRPNIMDKAVEFNDNGKAQVKESLGKKLIELYDSIEPVEKQKDKYKGRLETQYEGKDETKSN